MVVLFKFCIHFLLYRTLSTQLIHIIPKRAERQKPKVQFLLFAVCVNVVLNLSII